MHENICLGRGQPFVIDHITPFHEEIKLGDDPLPRIQIIGPIVGSLPSLKTVFNGADKVVDREWRYDIQFHRIFSLVLPRLELYLPEDFEFVADRRPSARYSREALHLQKPCVIFLSIAGSQPRYKTRGLFGDLQVDVPVVRSAATSIMVRTGSGTTSSGTPFIPVEDKLWEWAMENIASW